MPTSPSDYVDPFQGMPMAAAPGTSASGRMIPEMNALREWEDKHEQTLEETARQEAKDKEAKRQEAAAALQKFYAERQENTSKKMATNRSEEEAMEASRAGAMPASGNPWERVAELIDTNARALDESRDTSRMRALLIQLKSNPVVTSQ